MYQLYSIVLTGEILATIAEGRIRKSIMMVNVTILMVIIAGKENSIGAMDK